MKAYADGDPTRLRRLRGSFKVPVVPGGAIALFHGPGDPGDVHFRVTNAEGETALADGYAQLES